MTAKRLRPLKPEGGGRAAVLFTEAPGEKGMRLLGFERVELNRENLNVLRSAPIRDLLARFDGNADLWGIKEGECRVALGRSADDLVQTKKVPLKAQLFGSQSKDLAAALGADRRAHPPTCDDANKTPRMACLPWKWWKA